MKTNPSSISQPLENHLPRLFALALLAALLLSAIGRSHAQTTNPPPATPAGVYALASVDGKTVPCTINHEGTAMGVQSGTFTITTNGQCFSVMIVSVGDRKNLRCETRARYTLASDELTMQWQGAGMTKGRVAGCTFTMTNEDMAYVYRK